MPFRHNGIPDMELRHLRYFVAVARTLSFTKAATKLRIAQPALSRPVQDLEEEIGVDLFRRSPRGVTLTAEGELLLEEAEALLRQAESTIERVQALARGEYGELRIGYSPSASAGILPPALVAFGKMAPEVNGDIHFRKEVSARLSHDVRQGTHARKLMESYQTWLGEGPELSVLALVGPV